MCRVEKEGIGGRQAQVVRSTIVGSFVAVGSTILGDFVSFDLHVYALWDASKSILDKVRVIRAEYGIHGSPIYSCFVGTRFPEASCLTGAGILCLIRSAQVVHFYRQARLRFKSMMPRHKYRGLWYKMEFRLLAKAVADS